MNADKVFLNTVFYRDEEGIDVIHISDISENGQQTIQDTWKFDMLKENIRNEKISGVKLSFMDRQVRYLKKENISNKIR